MKWLINLFNRHADPAINGQTIRIYLAGLPQGSEKAVEIYLEGKPSGSFVTINDLRKILTRDQYKLFLQDETIFHVSIKKLNNFFIPKGKIFYGRQINPEKFTNGDNVIKRKKS